MRTRLLVLSGLAVLAAAAGLIAYLLSGSRPSSGKTQGSTAVPTTGPSPRAAPEPDRHPPQAPVAEETHYPAQDLRFPTGTYSRWPSQDELCLEKRVDITGDGKAEHIELIPEEPEDPIEVESGKFTLRVNGKAAIEDQVEPGIQGFYIADVDREDRSKEIVIYTVGLSDDFEHVLFWFDGKRLHKMGSLASHPQFPGNGIVYVNVFPNGVIRHKYIVTTRRRLRLVPQEFYYVGAKGVVLESFKLYRTRGAREAVANVRKGSEVLILLTDMSGDWYGDSWYLVCCESQLLGWAKYEELLRKLEITRGLLPYTD